MMRRFLNNVWAPRSSRVRGAVFAALAGCALLASASEADAQEIQITGPLAGAPAVRQLRLHRAKRFEVTPSVSFTILDEYQRTIMPGLRLTYHPTDWFGVGVWGGYGFQIAAHLTEELQSKAIDARQCDQRPDQKACQLTSVNLTRKPTSSNKNPSGDPTRTGTLVDDQLAKIQWIAAPQVTVIPFRGKLALFASLFVDTDVNFFVGPAFVGLQERKPCGHDDDGAALTPCSQSFSLESRLAIAPTFGLGLNFYPGLAAGKFFGFGVEWRGLPFAWNPSGFDNHGAGNDEAFPDLNVNGKDREFQFNSMLTVNLSIQFPMGIKTSE